MSNTIELSLTAFVVALQIKETANPTKKIQKDSINRKNFRTLVSMLFLQRGFPGSYNVTFYKKSDKHDLQVTAYFPYAIPDLSSITTMSYCGYDFELLPKMTKEVPKPTVHIMSSLKSVKKEQSELLKFMELAYRVYEHQTISFLTPEQQLNNKSIIFGHFCELKKLNTHELVESKELLIELSLMLYTKSNSVSILSAYPEIVSELPLTK